MKDMKRGKKRRSGSNVLISAEYPHIMRSRFYEEQPFLLASLFSTFKEDQVSDEELKQDFMLCMKAINKIEDFESKRKKLSQKYRQYPQESIDTLGCIIRKTPLTIGIDFSFYSHIASKANVAFTPCKDFHDFNRILKAMANVMRKVKKNECLPKLRFFPVHQTEEDTDPERVTYKDIRYLLAVGLFDYLQRVILGESGRPRQCPSCNNWFISRRTNNRTCSPKCKETYWRQFKGGREKRKIYMRQLRKNQKRGRISLSSEV